MVKKLKQKKTCKQCGNNDHRVLEFHHLSDKEFNVGEGIKFSKERLLKEIAKCEVLCANCHAKEHYKG